MKRQWMRTLVLATVVVAALAGELWSQEAPVEAGLNDLAFRIITRTHANPLGVEAAAVDAALRAQLGIEEDRGVVITSIEGDSDASKAGLKQHDVVLDIEECPINTPAKLHELIESQQGKKSVFHVLRQGKPLKVTIAVPKPAVYALVDEEEVGAKDAVNRYRIGVSLAEADDTLRSQLKLAAGEGLVVTDVIADSPAAKAGIKQHDVLIKLDNKRLSTVESINAQIQEIKDREATAVLLRSGKELSCQVKPQLSKETKPEWVVERFDRLFHGMSKEDRARHSLQNWIRRPNSAVDDLAARLSRDYVHWVDKSSPDNALTELAKLKEQLAQMQKTLATLETALQPAGKKETQAPKEE